MSFFAMSDIHGCYDDFISMLGKIEYDPDDCLILCGDYIDRGEQSCEMVKWIEEQKSPKVVLLRGNHEEEFIACVDILNTIDDSRPLLEICTMLHNKLPVFDLYGTIRFLVSEKGFTLEDLNHWADLFKSMMLKFRRKIGARIYMFVHAGYLKGKEAVLYARREAYESGGMDGVTVVAGHTPTIIKGEFTYNNGDVFYYESGRKRFFDIDCGCFLKWKYENAKLACIRLDDEKIFYV